MKKFRLPYGVQDYLPEECYQKEQLEKTLAGVFYRAGFERVETPALEYYDLYDGVLDGGNFNKMFKITDSDGSLLVLRPDITLQISRMAATKLSAGLNKLYYIENSYEFLPDSQGSSARSREFAQVGIEIVGKSGAAGDTEAVILAVEALLACGLTDFLIDIGHADYFNGVAAQFAVSPAAAAELKRIINNKDAAGFDALFTQYKIAQNARVVFEKMSTLYGGAEVLDVAAKLTDNPVSCAAIDGMRAILNAVKLCGYEKYVSVDLGLLKSGYYTGLVMRGIAKDFGASILDGGRYDNLGGAFGKKSEAVGFAIGTKRLLSALERQVKPAALPPCDVAYIHAGGCVSAEFAFVSALRKKGKRVIKLFCMDKAELKAYCKRLNISRAVMFTESGIEEVL
ncbi:MAG: ATP phosphoribosyltransferase regulatory subunit [Firmicutes bacterium]|nr:ATP phosphoribosyltransferase regulatory subunit [Bacillota bacterium]